MVSRYLRGRYGFAMETELENITAIETHPLGTRSERSLPEAGRNVIVISKGLRCLGFCDEEGDWHGITNRVLPDVIGWEVL